MIQSIKNFLRKYKYRKELEPMINSYLFFLENKEQSIWGSITEEEEKGIARAVEYAKNFDGPIVEIGALFGHTTQLIATLKDKDKELIAVENFTWNPFGLSKDIHQLITYRTLRYCIEKCNTKIFYGSNNLFYEIYKGKPFSMIFIDAGHNYEDVIFDIQMSKKLNIPVICGHDFHDLHKGVKKAVIESFGTEIETYGSVWIANCKIYVSPRI